MLMFPHLTFLRAVPVRSQAGHGQLRFLLNTYSHPCSCQSAHPAVNPSSQTQQRLTRGLTTQFISLSLSSLVSIHHSPALIHLRKSDVYENINRQSFSFQQHKDLSCVFQVYSLTGLMLHLQQERPVLSAPSHACHWCCWFCLHDSRSLRAAGRKSRLSLQKLCPTPLRSPFLSSTLPIPCNFLPPLSVWALFDVSLPRLRVTRQIFSCHLRTPEAICQFQLVSCVHCALVTQSNASNGRCWPCMRVWLRARACVLSLAAWLTQPSGSDKSFTSI